MHGSTESGLATSQTPAIEDHIPTSPSAPEQVLRLLTQVDGYGKAFADNDPEARVKLLEATRALMYALETPRESMIRYCWAQVCVSGAWF